MNEHIHRGSCCYTAHCEKRSFSRLVVEESARILEALGCETRIFNPQDLPIADSQYGNHPKVQELHELMTWSEGQVWCSPEKHGNMSSIIKKPD